MKIDYPQLNETVYEETLPNGLKVVLVPRAGFQKTYGLFTTNYGSIDEEFIPLGATEPVKVPEGIAHFLEHKLFEKEDGDVFQKFSQLGASANAFTSFTKTSYLFSATEKVYENLQILLDFVQEPYFTAESVNKEKGIIAQEIQMYQDEPNWRLFFGLIQNLYPKHPLHIDIAGTVASIQEITAEDLYLCYRTFYHPSNMTLLVVGNFAPQEMLDFIYANQDAKDFPPAEPLMRFFPAETAADIVPEQTLYMDIVTPKGAVGYRGFTPIPEDGLAQMKLKATGNLLFELLLGESSENYLRLYNAGLADDSFGYEFNVERGFYFADFSSDSPAPQELVAALTEILDGGATSPELTAERLRLAKKQTLGKYLQSLNSLEYIANQFFQSSGTQGNLYQIPEVLASVTLEDIKNFAADFLQKEHRAVCYMYPLAQAAQN